ncbi:MAG: hydrogenase maturation protease [Chloroflexi bacterium]|nr:hydrogenase maturation protease [Chloroflexota bacterium]
MPSRGKHPIEYGSVGVWGALPHSHTPTLILGLGNPLLGDDGVGWRVLEQLKNKVTNSEFRIPDFEFGCHAGGGLSLMERLVGYERAILIDALATDHGPPGTVHHFALEAMTNPAAGHLSSSHDTTLQNALAAGRELGVELPREIVLVAIESPRVWDFAPELSPRVADAVPRAVVIVQEILRRWTTPTSNLQSLRDASQSPID